MSNVKLNKIDSKLRELIKSIDELKTGKCYLIDVSNDIPLYQIKQLVDTLNKNKIGWLIIPEGYIKNLYELEGGDVDDSRTSIK